MSLRPRIWYQVSKTIFLLRHIHFSNTYSLQTWKFQLHNNCRNFNTKYVKNANHLGIVRNSKWARMKIPANIRTYLSWKSALRLLQLILNITISLFSLFCRRIVFYDFLKTQIRNFLWQFFSEKCNDSIHRII